jgi:hypothetical protein
MPDFFGNPVFPLLLDAPIPWPLRLNSGDRQDSQ